MSEIIYRNTVLEDITQLKRFTDKEIGKNYYSEKDLEIALLLAYFNDLNCSFVAMDGSFMAGARITFAPGVWIDERTKGITPEWWNVEPQYVAYFKSLFVDEKYQQRGIGKTLSQKSIEVLRQMGAKAIVCHSWLQSPENSSQIYLKRMGFESVKEHIKFWADVDYDCTVCKKPPCMCSALEMIYYL